MLRMKKVDEKGGIGRMVEIGSKVGLPAGEAIIQFRNNFHAKIREGVWNKSKNEVATGLENDDQRK